MNNTLKYVFKPIFFFPYLQSWNSSMKNKGRKNVFLHSTFLGYHLTICI